MERDSETSISMCDVLLKQNLPVILDRGESPEIWVIFIGMQETLARQRRQRDHFGAILTIYHNISYYLLSLFILTPCSSLQLYSDLAFLTYVLT